MTRVGDVYLAHDILTEQEVAIKLEQERHAQLEHKFYVYNQIAGGLGIPHVYWFGCEMGFNVMALEHLGPSLADLFIQCNLHFSVFTVAKLAVQLVR